MDDRMTLAALRVRAGYNQDEAAGHLGVSKATLAKWEQDSRNMPSGRIDTFMHLYQVPDSVGIYIGDATALSERIRARYAQYNESARKKIDVTHQP